MRVDSTQHTHRGACAGWGRSRECSHQSDAQRRLRAEIRSSVRARCRLPRVARVSLSLRCARAPFGQRVREARIEGGCASRRTLRMPLFRYQGSSRAGGKESSPSKGCFHTPCTVRPLTRTPNPQPAQCVRDLLSYVNEVDSIGIPFLRRRRFAAMSQFTAQSSTRAAKFSFRDAPEDAPDQFTGKVFISTVPRTPDRRTHRCKFNTAERVLPVGISYSTGRQYR